MTAEELRRAIARWNVRLRRWCALPDEDKECEGVVEMICALREEMDLVLEIEQPIASDAGARADMVADVDRSVPQET